MEVSEWLSGFLVSTTQSSQGECALRSRLGRDVKVDDLRQMFLAMAEEVRFFSSSYGVMMSHANIYLKTKQFENAALLLKVFLLPSV